MFLRQDPKAWQADLNRMAERALGAGTVLSLAGIAFLAVFREGAETVLFLHALAKTANGFDSSLLGGLGVAVIALAAVFVAMQWLALRLPLRPMFLITSAFLFVMGLRLVGQALQEFQEQTIVPVHNDGVPGFVTDLGFNGSWEALGAQGVLVLGAVACLALFWFRRGDRKAAARRTRRRPRPCPEGSGSGRSSGSTRAPRPPSVHGGVRRDGEHRQGHGDLAAGWAAGRVWPRAGRSRGSAEAAKAPMPRARLRASSDVSMPR